MLFRYSQRPSENVKNLDELKEKIKTRPNALFEMEAFLPKKNGWWPVFINNINKIYDNND